MLKLTLYSDSYSWEFISQEGKTFTDHGSAPCVNPGKSVIYDVLSFKPTDDVTNRLRAPEMNFGSREIQEVEKNPDDNFLIKFDVTGLKDRIFVSAKLRMYNLIPLMWGEAYTAY